MRDLSFLKLTIANLTGLGLLALVFWQGWLLPLFLTDNTYAVYGMTALFAIGLYLCEKKAYQLANWGSTQFTPAGYFDDFLAVPTEIMENTVLLGLIGTVFGFAIAMSGVTVAQLSNHASLIATLGILFPDMAVALLKTAVGAVLAMWLGWNILFLRKKSFAIGG